MWDGLGDTEKTVSQKIIILNIEYNIKLNIISHDIAT